ANRLLLARTQASQTVSMDGVDVSFNLELEVPHGDIRDLICEYPAELSPLRVTSRQADIEWWKPTSPGATSSAISVHLREPFAGRVLQLKIECRAPLSLNSTWSCPGLSVRGAVPLNE